MNEIFFVHPSLTDKVKNISFSEPVALRRDFEFVLELGSSAVRGAPVGTAAEPPRGVNRAGTECRL